MEARLNYAKASPQGYRAVLALDSWLEKCGLEPLLLELVRLRASQINGCAYCLDMQSKDARALGESEQRLYGLSAWREAPYYTERERAALRWTEELTLVHLNHVPETVADEVRRHFSDEEWVSEPVAGNCYDQHVEPARGRVPFRPGNLSVYENPAAPSGGTLREMCNGIHCAA